MKSARASDVTAAGLFWSTITHFDSLALSFVQFRRQRQPVLLQRMGLGLIRCRNLRIPGARTPTVVQRYGRGGPGPSPRTDEPAPLAPG
jgi:hypothetical protein